MGTGKDARTRDSVWVIFQSLTKKDWNRIIIDYTKCMLQICPMVIVLIIHPSTSNRGIQYLVFCHELLIVVTDIDFPKCPT
jgi:hypothetical protein